MWTCLIKEEKKYGKNALFDMYLIVWCMKDRDGKRDRDKQTDIQTNGSKDRLKGTETNIQTFKQMDLKTDRYTSRCTDRHAYQETRPWTDRRTDRQTYR